MPKAVIPISGKKLCSSCGKLLSLENFHKGRKYVCGFRSACKDCRREHAKNNYWNKGGRQKYRDNWKEVSQRMKKIVLTHYGADLNKPMCTKCGFDNVKALSIDHIGGGGNQHRKKIKTWSIYRWLINQGFPSGYQTLCMNCQWIKKLENKEHNRTHET